MTDQSDNPYAAPAGELRSDGFSFLDVLSIFLFVLTSPLLIPLGFLFCLAFDLSVRRAMRGNRKRSK